MSPQRPIKRITDPNISIGLGVCAGLAYGLGMKTWILRTIVCLGIAFTFFSAVVVYFILGFLMPKWGEVPEDYKAICE